MKKSIFALSVFLFLATTLFAGDFPDYRGVVNDFEDVLTDKQESGLTKIIEKNEIKNNVKIILVSTKNYTPAKDFRTYVFGLFGHWKMNAESGKNGMLVLVSKNQKDLKIIPGKNVKVIFGDREIKDVVENVMTPKFLAGKHFAGLKKGIKSMVKTIKNFNKVSQ